MTDDTAALDALRRELGQGLFGDLAIEIARQNMLAPDGYKATYLGMRCAVALLEDEVREVRDAWRQERCKCPTPECDHSTWEKTREELVQVAALALRILDQRTRP